jgi:hypothetical protein
VTASRCDADSRKDGAQQATFEEQQRIVTVVRSLADAVRDRELGGASMESNPVVSAVSPQDPL